MPYYVELLRAKRALIVAAVILGLLLATAIVVRISLGGDSVQNWPAELSGSPTAHVTHSVLADGSKKTGISDPARQTTAVIVEHPDKTLDMQIDEPNASRSRHHHISMGSIYMNENLYAGGKMRHVVAHYRPQIPAFQIGILFLVTIPIGLIVATMLSGVLAKENDGHLELAWTKPVSREQYALGLFGIDAAAIITAQLATIIVLFAACLVFFVPRLSSDLPNGWQILLALLGPFAWYSLLTAGSAMLKRGPGLIIGMGWIAAVMVPALAGALQEAAKSNAVANAFYRIFDTISFADPIVYLSFHVNGDGIVHTATGMTVAAAAAALAILIAVYLTLSVLQWRRVEA